MVVVTVVVVVVVSDRSVVVWCGDCWHSCGGTVVVVVDVWIRPQAAKRYWLNNAKAKMPQLQLTMLRRKCHSYS